MGEYFFEPIRKLPQADVPLEGVTAYLSQAEDHQIIFMHFSREVDLVEHAHAAQIGFVLEGEIDLVIGGVANTFKKGDAYHIPEGVKHSGRIHAGYADITFFDELKRYQAKKSA